MGEAVERRERPPVKDWMTIIVFDGRGGVRKLSDEEETKPYSVPQKGFVLIAGNSRSPDFKVWLREELGDFISDSSGLGYAGGAALIGGALAVVAILKLVPHVSAYDLTCRCRYGLICRFSAS